MARAKQECWEGKWGNSQKITPRRRSILPTTGHSFIDQASGVQPDIGILGLIRGVPARLTFDPACDNLPIWSPDGLRVLFPSNRSGSFDLYLKTATGAGSEPCWRRDGTELFYVAADGNLMAVLIILRPAFEPGLPARLMPLPAKAQLHSYAISGDGQRFLVVSPAEGETSAPLTVLVNWQAALKK